MTPSNVVLTSLVSWNTSATFKTLSTFAITASWTSINSILSLVIPETPTLFDKVTLSGYFWVTTVPAGISWPITLSPASTFVMLDILSSAKYMYFLSPPWSAIVLTSTEFGKNGKLTVDPEVVAILTWSGVVVPTPTKVPPTSLTINACVAKPTLVTTTLTSKLTP